MTLLPVRLQPGSDLRLALEQVLARQGEQAGFVVSGIGSLSRACLRLAGQETVTALEGDSEILSLAGSLSPDGAHLHISVADAQGRVMGGHLGVGSLVRTTAEVLVLLLPHWSFRRGPDPLTGAMELQIEPREAL
jgi:predicted DNA-binding protein with PD1-like motif